MEPANGHCMRLIHAYSPPASPTTTRWHQISLQWLYGPRKCHDNRRQAQHNSTAATHRRAPHRGPPQGSPQGSLGNRIILCIVFDLFGIFAILGQILRFFVKITWFFSLSNKKDAESSRNFIEILVLEPKRSKFVQQSYGKFTESLRNLPRPIQEDP